jgi:hypothetical protein
VSWRREKSARAHAVTCHRPSLSLLLSRPLIPTAALSLHRTRSSVPEFIVPQPWRRMEDRGPPHRPVSLASPTPPPSPPSAHECRQPMRIACFRSRSHRGIVLTARRYQYPHLCRSPPLTHSRAHVLRAVCCGRCDGELGAHPGTAPTRLRPEGMLAPAPPQET